MLLAGLLLSAAGGPHVGSYSLSEIHIRRDQVQLQLRCQVLSLGEVIGPFDPNLDGEMEPGELEENQDAILSYVAEHYSLDYGAERVPLTVRSATVIEGPMAPDPLNEISEWLDIVVDFEPVDLEAFRSLGVKVDLFYDTSPQHRDSAAVVWNGVELGAWQFDQSASTQVFEPSPEMLERNVRPLVRFAAAGWKRIFSLLDGALLALLFVAAGRRGSRASGLSSAAIFAVLMAVGLVAAPMANLLPQHVRFLELAVPLALGYVGLDDLLHNRGRTRILETAVFGLLLGGREATRLAPELAQEASSREPLVGFALGLGGALLCLAGLAALVLGARRSEEADAKMDPVLDEHEEAAARSGAFAWRPLRLALDLGSMAVGLWLFWGVFRG